MSEPSLLRWSASQRRARLRRINRLYSDAENAAPVSFSLGEHKRLKAEALKYIEELQHTAVVAALNYEIWWTYKEKESRAKYVNTMNLYTLFFQSSIHAHFVALLIALYRLYETRDDTLNVRGLLALLEKCHDFPCDALAELKQLSEEANKLWIKVCILRNEVFGHRSKKYSVTDVFKRAKVKPKELRELIEKTEDILNKARYPLDRGSYSYLFNLRSEATEDTTRLLDDLKEFKELRSTQQLDGTR